MGHTPLPHPCLTGATIPQGDPRRPHRGTLWEVSVCLDPMDHHPRVIRTNTACQGEMGTNTTIIFRYLFKIITMDAFISHSMS